MICIKVSQQWSNETGNTSTAGMAGSIVPMCWRENPMVSDSSPPLIGLRTGHSSLVITLVKLSLDLSLMVCCFVLHFFQVKQISVA
jgi:hypothetical protein